jgi:2-succinyl-6-hydroxy-2,4-cyclohexadiene-1-carboxylate synthase
LGGDSAIERLLLLHGFTGSGASWAPLLPALSERFAPLTVDLPGHGRHPPSPRLHDYEMTAVAANLAQFIETTATPPIYLLGYSMGGRAALYFALHYPHLVKGLILESASPGLASEAERAARRQSDEALADWIEANGIESFVKRWEKLPLWASQEQLPAESRAALRQQRLQNSPLGLANSLRGMGTGAQSSLWPRLPELAMPVLLIVGELDEKFTAINRQMAAQIPQARLEIVPGVGHTAHWERPLVYAHLCNSFPNYGL